MYNRLPYSMKTATAKPFDYLQACALIRKRRAEETRDDAHDCLRYITLQHGICVLPVTGVVAHLDINKHVR